MTALPDDLDPGIRLTVAWLNREGFTTTDSGDGVSKPDMECALGTANVFVRVASPVDLIAEARRLHTLLESVGVRIGPQGPEGPAIQATYDPGDDSAIIALYGVDDEAIRQGKSSLMFESMRSLRARANVAVMGNGEKAPE